jgi:hypothetical protein
MGYGKFIENLRIRNNQLCKPSNHCESWLEHFLVLVAHLMRQGVAHFSMGLSTMDPVGLYRYRRS